ncbi:MAG TPA: hypothetical protein VGW38_15355 [Chloroflexota bacterium]|nr:hypothetical protein [Chloroflexota bacterium]
MSMTDNALAGAMGGLAGGVAMSAMMMMGKKAGIVQTPVPVKVERWVEDQAGVPTHDRADGMQEMGIAQGGHLLLSAAFGAGYGALRGAYSLPAMPSGPLYGLGLYALNLGGIAPTLGITPGPWNEEPMTAGRRMMMHLMYGAVTALLTERLAPYPRPVFKVIRGGEPLYHASEARLAA